MERKKIENNNFRNRKKFFLRRLICLLGILIFILLIIYFIMSSFIKEESYRGIYNKNISSRQIENIKENLNIKEANYTWGIGLKKGNNPKKIVIHHSATEVSKSPEEIHKIHLEKGWSGIGYHFYIKKDGTIYKGREENVIGAHAKGANYNTLGICVEGNFEKDGLKEKQKNSLINLGAYLSLKYPIKDVIMHRDVVDTLCPGSLFPIDTIKQGIINKIKNM